MKHTLIPVLAAVLLAGCATTPERVDRHNDKGPEVMGLDYRDFNEAVVESLRSLFEEGTLDRDDGRYVIYVGRVINKTTQNWETTQLTKGVTIELRKSKKAVVTAIPPDSDEPGLKPQLIMTGKVSERNIQISSGKKQTEYYLELELTDCDPDSKTRGAVFWEGQAPIVKRGSSKTVNW